MLDVFKAGKADILIGTQMIAKGLDFPNVTLVGVLNADTSLNMPDPRATERTYQLLAQVSGRAGRAEKPGEVFIQTFSPEVSAIKAAASNSGYAAFAEEEMRSRKSGYFPPYCRMARIIVQSKSKTSAEGWSSLYAESLQNYAAKASRSVSGALGPFIVNEAMESPLSKIDNLFRYQIVMRAASAKLMTDAFKWISSLRPVPDDVRITYDVDALSFM
jgi:primosomal protein N' (replication factor Y)